LEERLNYIAAAPEGYRAFGGVHRYIAGCGLEPTLVELVYFRVSQINGCAYCVDLHFHQSVKLGIDPRKLNSLGVWRESPFFSDRERVAFAWAESLTRIAGGEVSDEDFRAAREQFSEKELADLTYAVALMNAFNRLGGGLRYPRIPA
jgi:AhpD family alkylhydroperoxidase